MGDIGPVKRVVRSIPLPAGTPEPASVPKPVQAPAAPQHFGSVPA